MEQLFYEARPFALLLFAYVGPKLSHGSSLAVGSGVLLLLATAMILHARFMNRVNFRKEDFPKK